MWDCRISKYQIYCEILRFWYYHMIFNIIMILFWYYQMIVDISFMCQLMEIFWYYHDIILIYIIKWWLSWYINNSCHLARKHAQIFVHGHYLFREANSFPRAKLEENCELRGTDNVLGQISEHIFATNGNYCLYYPSNLFRNACSFENWGIFSDIPRF